MAEILAGPAMEQALTQVADVISSMLGHDSDDVTVQMAAEHLAGGGKQLRARLAIAVAEELGVSAADAVVWAAACELFHNGTLVHDDLQDGDRVRRDRPTVWVRHGMEQAINVGDLLLILPFATLSRLSAKGEMRAALADVLSRGACTVIRGQALEFAAKRAGDTSWSTYERMIGQKTSALFELPVHGAGLLAGRSRAQAAAWGGIFHSLGLLFQMQDDVVDLFGNKGRLSAGSDIAEGKISALVVEHLALQPDDRAWLMRVLHLPRKQTRPEDIAEVIARFRERGALKTVLERIRIQADRFLEAAGLAGEPALGAIAQALVEYVLAPLREVSESKT